ncbi:MAG: TonB-dependent receptor [Parvibaculales bacterium]
MTKKNPSRKALYLLAAATCSVPATAVSQENSIDEIIIRSAPFQQKATDIISTTHAVGRDTIDTLTGKPIGTLLQTLPGVDVASHGPAVGRPVIRGQSGYRIAVLQNGLQSGDVSETANDHANSDLVYDQQRIEVLKGPSALRYGPYAGTGIVNSFSRSLDFSTQAQTSVTATFGSAADTEQAGFFTRQAAGDYVGTLSGFYSDSGNIRIPTHAESAAQLASEGETAIDAEQDAENTSSRLEELKAGLAWNGTDRRWILNVGQTTQELGIPGHHHHEEEHHDEDHEDHDEHEEEEGGVRSDMEKTFATLIYEHDLKPGSDPLRLKFGYTDYTHTEFEGDAAGTKFDKQQAEIRLDLPYTGLAGGDGLFGASVRTAELETSGDEAFLPSVDQEDFGLHLIERLSSGEWKTELAARIDNTSYDTAQTSKSFDTINLSAGIGYQSDASSLIGGSLSWSERPPAPTELFADGLHAAVMRYERGDANLDVEESVAAELYYRSKWGQGNFKAALFMNDYDSFIFLKDSGQVSGDETIYMYSQGKAEITGLELGYTLSGKAAWGNWRSELGYAHMRGEEDDGTPLLYIPAEKLTLSFAASKGTWDASFDVIAAERQTRVPASQMPTDGYVKLDAGLKWTPPSVSGLTVMLQGENLTNEEIRHHSSALKDLLPEPGRNIVLRTRLDF